MVKVVDWIKFGELIAVKRKEKDISKVSFAKALRVSDGAVSCVEQGRPTRLVTEVHLERIQQVLDIQDTEVPWVEDSSHQQKKSRTEDEKLALLFKAFGL
jgi:transcriptional regulator with XRE-family HTH domain